MKLSSRKSPQSLERLRGEVRKLDGQILRLISRRLELAKKIGELKRGLGLPLTDTNIEQQVLRHAIERGKRFNIHPSLIKSVISLLILESRKVQHEPFQDDRLNPPEGQPEIFEIAEAMRNTGEEVIRLDVGEPELRPPQSVISSAQRALDERKLSVYGSSWGLPELRQALAEHLEATYGVDVRPECVLVTPGGKFAVYAGILAKASPFEKVCVVEPAWPAYRELVEMVNCITVTVATNIEKRWEIDVAQLREALKSGVTILILNTPNNPTGKIIPRKLLEEICDCAARCKVTVISDEVYSAYAFKPFTSVLQANAECPTIRVGSFSKNFGMTGWRIGFAVSDEKTIARMRKILQATTTCVPGFIQKAALAALASDSVKSQELTSQIKARLKVGYDELRRLPVKICFPEGGMYLFPQVNAKNFNAQSFALHLLKEEKVAISPGNIFGSYSDHFRISASVDVKALREGVRRMGRLLELLQTSAA